MALEEKKDGNIGGVGSPSPPPSAPTGNGSNLDPSSLSGVQNLLKMALGGNQSPAADLNTEDIFPGYTEPLIAGHYTGKIVGSVPLFGSGDTYFPYNIAEKKRLALNNAMIAKGNQEQKLASSLQVDPYQTHDMFQRKYDEIFLDGLGDVWKQFDKDYNGNKIQAYKDVTTNPNSPAAKVYNNYLGNMRGLATEGKPLFDLATKIVNGTEGKQYFSPEAKETAAKILNGKLDKDKLKNDPSYVSDLIADMRGYDNLDNAFANDKNLDAIITPDLTNKEFKFRRWDPNTGKAIFDEIEIMRWAKESDVKKKAAEYLLDPNNGYSFSKNQSSPKRMEAMLGYYMKEKVKNSQQFEAPHTGDVNVYGGGYGVGNAVFNPIKPRTFSNKDQTAYGDKAKEVLTESTFNSETKQFERNGRPVLITNKSTGETVDTKKIFDEAMAAAKKADPDMTPKRKNEVAEGIKTNIEKRVSEKSSSWGVNSYNLVEENALTGRKKNGAEIKLLIGGGQMYDAETDKAVDANEVNNYEVVFDAVKEKNGEKVIEFTAPSYSEKSKSGKTIKISAGKYYMPYDELSGQVASEISADVKTLNAVTEKHFPNAKASAPKVEPATKEQLKDKMKGLWSK